MYYPVRRYKGNFARTSRFPSKYPCLAHRRDRTRQESRTVGEREPSKQIKLLRLTWRFALLTTVICFHLSLSSISKRQSQRVPLALLFFFNFSLRGERHELALFEYCFTSTRSTAVSGIYFFTITALQIPPFAKLTRVQISRISFSEGTYIWHVRNQI